MPDLLPVDEGEVAQEASDELYFRQCHPSFVQGGQPSSQFLGDFPRDGGKLSGTRSSVVNATESYLDHVADGKSAGTWAMTFAQAIDHGSQVVDDSGAPQTTPPRPRGHVYLDLRHLSGPERKAVVSAMLITFRDGGQRAALGDFV